MSPFRSLLLLALALVFSAAAAASAQEVAAESDSARVAVFVFSDGRPLAGVRVRANAVEAGLTNANGAARLRVPAGLGRIELHYEDSLLLDVVLTWSPGELAELIVTANSNQPPRYSLESSHQAQLSQAPEPLDVQDPGRLAGRITSVEDGSPVVGARIFVAGTPVDLQTDAEGRFELELSPGRYAISIIAARFAAQTLDGIEIVTGQTTERDIELSPAGLELPEFVVLEPFVEGSLASFVEERRTSAAVTDILGAEQISRAGDSDAAGALRRVTGLTLVDGKFIYVRGLGERYSSVLLNGAQIPSPDPTRRVVPLDLFPTEILSGVVVQKTYSPDMPGEFGGGTVGLRTRGFPEAPLFRVAASLGASDGTTFEDGFSYRGGRRDWTGRDDGSRRLPATLDQIRREGRFLRQRSPANPQGLTPDEIQQVGREVAGVYNLDSTQVVPDSSLSLGGGTRWQLGDDWTLGFLGSARHSRKFDTRTEERNFFVATASGLELRDSTRLERTNTDIDVSGFFTAGASYGERHALRSTLLFLRQTSDTARLVTGRVDNQDLERYRLEWIENLLRAQQLSGEHSLPWFVDRARFEWLGTRAYAQRYAPNTRDYRINISPEGIRELSLFGESNISSWSQLDDASRSYDLKLDLPFRVGGRVDGKLQLFHGQLERERDSFIRRYQFSSRFPNTPAGIAERTAVIRRPTMEDIINAGTIRPNGFILQEVTQPTDNYFAEQELAYRGLAIDVNLFERLRLNLGLREEDNFQEVVTFSVTNPNDRSIGLIDEVSRLPAAAATWQLDARQQLRLGYSQTLSRPDFRELTSAPYVDPILDLITFGNPNLVTAEIKNYDLRWEYYFSEIESVSVALFRKSFTNPIEKQLLPGSGSILLTLANADAATNQGIEFDIYKQAGFVGRWLDARPWSSRLWLDRVPWPDVYLSANYAWIKSEIQLNPLTSGFNTNLERPLEGQSPYVINLQLGYIHPDGLREFAVLYNLFGERIVQVGVDGQPDTYEQPAGQLDFTYRQRFGRGWSARLRLRNLLDPRVEFRQGDGVLREYKRGREIGISVEWSPL